MHIDRIRLRVPLLAFGLLGAACITPVGEGSPPDSGSSGTGGRVSSGGITGSGGGKVQDGSGGKASGGTVGSGGTTSSGGKVGSGGQVSSGSSGGTLGSGGVVATGGSVGSGGVAASSGGTVGSGGTTAAGGRGAGNAGGRAASGGASATGGSGTGNTGGTVDACSMTGTLSGGMAHMSANASGTAAGLGWTIWSNGSAGTITTYDTPAFSASWNNSGDFLARMGLQWNASKTFDQYGTINAQYAAKKSGSGGQYSYIGIYGWSVSPCIEFYIVDDSYNKMPVNPGSTTNKGTATIDGGTYTLYTRPTMGTGGSKCSGVTNWTQFYSVRQSARSCGQISISEHFKAWAAAGMTLGKMDQAQLLIEVGGGTGSIDFTSASITTSQ